MSLAELAARAVQKPVEPPTVESLRQIALQEAWAALQAKDEKAFTEAFNNAIEIALAESK